MHEEWRDQIAFYTAGTLPEAETKALREHLSTCSYCRTEYEEWQIVAHAVRADAESVARKLPPLSVSVRDNLQHDRRNYATPHSETIELEVTGGGSPRRWGAITLTAAAAITVIIAGMLVIMANRPGLTEENPTEQAVAVLITEDVVTTTPNPAANSTPESGTGGGDLGILPIPQPTLTVAAPASTLSPASIAPVDGLLPPVTSQSCVIENNITGVSVPIYVEPGRQYAQLDVKISPFTSATAFERTSDGWLRIEYISDGVSWVGWVFQGDVSVSAVCHQLPVTASVEFTPVARYNNLIGVSSHDLMLAETVGGAAAYTRVRISSAWYDGSGWIYEVVAENGLVLQVREDQLALASAATSVPDFPPTPTAGFDSSIGQPGYDLVTTQQVGTIAPHTRVRISSAWYAGNGWRYQIVATDEVSTAEAQEHQLVYYVP